MIKFIPPQAPILQLDGARFMGMFRQVSKHFIKKNGLILKHYLTGHLMILMLYLLILKCNKFGKNSESIKYESICTKGI